jgi:hypothetical protein
MSSQSKPHVSSIADPEEVICIPSTALHIEAEVVRWVYTVGSEKPSAASKTATLKTASHQASGFFGSLFAGFGGSSTPRRTPTPVPVVPTTSTNLLEAHPSNVTLSIFSANVDVRLNKKMTAELLRSTKKNPPSRLRYELIYVSFTVVKYPLKIGSHVGSDGEG